MPATGPVRRNNGPSSSPISPSKSKAMSGLKTTPSSSPSPLLPTPLETALLSIYPLTLLLGSLFSLLEPSARRAPYNVTLQSHPPDVAPSYFALKSNLLNLYFVKIAWAWFTLAYFAFLFLHRINGPPGLTFTPRKLRGLVRYSAVTAIWFGMTQWFFGPALIDRGFTVTGGACELAEQYKGEGGAKEAFSAKACKAVGGAWRGGHDISGHVFILVLAGAFLGMEMLPALVQGSGVRDERVVKGREGNLASVDGDGSLGVQDEQNGWTQRIALWLPAGVAGLSWWMLLMTAAYFHTWFEKLTGLLVAFTALFTVFLLPRQLPGLRDVLGLPGK